MPEQIVVPGSFPFRHRIVRSGRTYEAVGTDVRGTTFQEVGRGDTFVPASFEGMPPVSRVSRLRPVRRFASGATFDPNTSTFVYPDGTTVSTDNPELANQQLVQEQRQQQQLTQRRARVTGFVPAGTTLQERQLLASQLRPEEAGKRPTVVAAAALARQAVEQDQEQFFIPEGARKGVEIIRERFIPGIPLGISFGGIRAGLATFIRGGGRGFLRRGVFETEKEFIARTARETPKEAAKLAREATKAVQPTVKVSPLGIAKRVGVGLGLAGAGAAAPGAVRMAAIGFTPELAGVQTETPLIQKFRERAFRKASEAVFKEEKELFTKEGAVQAAYGLFPPAKGAFSEVFRETFKREFVKEAETVLTTKQARALAEADLAAQVYGGALSIGLAETGAEVVGRGLAPPIFRRVGTRTGTRRFLAGFATAAPAGVVEAEAATLGFAAAEAQPVKPMDFLTAGLFGAGAAGTFTGTAAVIAPFRGGRVVGRGFELVDVPGEQFGNIGANILTRAGLSLPEPRITRIRGGITSTLFGTTKPTPTPVPTPVTEPVPTKVPIEVKQPVVTPVPASAVSIDVTKPVPQPIEPIEPIEPIVTPIPVPAEVPTEQELTIPVDVGVPTPISTTVPIPIVSATGFPFLPLFGFGTGATRTGKKQQIELYNELAAAMNATFGPGFVKTIKARVPAKKTKKRGRKTRKPIRFI